MASFNHRETPGRRLKWDANISPGHIDRQSLPLHNFPFFLHGVTVGHFTFRHHHPPIYSYSIKRYTVNVYKLIRVRSVRVRSAGLCQLSNFRFNSRREKMSIGGEGNCSRGKCPRRLANLTSTKNSKTSGFGTANFALRSLQGAATWRI